MFGVLQHNLHRIAAALSLFRKLSNTADQSDRTVLVTCIGEDFYANVFLSRCTSLTVHGQESNYATNSLLLLLHYDNCLYSLVPVNVPASGSMLLGPPQRMHGSQSA